MSLAPTKKTNQSTFFKIIQYVYRNNYNAGILILISIFLLFFITLFEFFSSASIIYMIRAVKEGDRKKIFDATLYYLILKLSKSLSFQVIYYFYAPIITEIKKKWTVAQIKLIYESDFLDFSKYNVGQISHKIHNCATGVGVFFNQGVSQIIPTASNLIFLSVFMIYYFGWHGLLTYLVFLVVYFAVTFFIVRKRLRLQKGYIEAETVLSNLITEKIKNKDTTVLMTMKDYELFNFDSQYFRQQEKEIKYWKSMSYLNFFQSTCIYIFYFYFIVFCITKNPSTFTVEMYVLASNMLILMFYYLEFLGWVLEGIFEGFNKIENGFIFDSDFNREIVRESDQILVESIRKLEFKNISLLMNRNLIYENVNLLIEKPESYCIIGPNGAGKSSFIKLLTNIFKKTGGDYFINNTVVENVNINSFHKRISYANQDAHLFNGTILENITYGNNKTFSDVIKVAEFFNVHNNFITKKDGYATNIGFSGTSLSGGEKQRVALMRTVMRDADIFIFDEPTANVEKSVEIFFIKKIMEFLNGKIIFCVIHNLDLVRYFDKVLFFNNKTLESVGTHSNLLETNTNYSEFFNRVNTEK